jgi:sugar phosphate isomerase/epimerase
VKILITDWDKLDQVLPIALKYRVGMELLEFAQPDNLDGELPNMLDLRQRVSTLPVLGLHGPFTELVPATRDLMVRKVIRTRFEQGYELAQKLGASHYILHSGFIPKTYPREIWLQKSFDFWVEFLADKPRTNMIHMENVYEDDFTSILELTDRVNQTLGEERLTLCLDIGHVNSNSSKTLAEWIIGLGDRIRYTHLHNNDGILDDHWRLDNGGINMSEVLELLEKHSPHALWTIETILSDIEPSLLWLQRKGYL